MNNVKSHNAQTYVKTTLIGGSLPYCVPWFMLTMYCHEQRECTDVVRPDYLDRVYNAKHFIGEHACGIQMSGTAWRKLVKRGAFTCEVVYQRKPRIAPNIDHARYREWLWFTRSIVLCVSWSTCG